MRERTERERERERALELDEAVIQNAPGELYIDRQHYDGKKEEKEHHRRMRVTEEGWVMMLSEPWIVPFYSTMP